MHSSCRHKGKLTERWGRKASGLRAWAPRTAGLPTGTLNDTVPMGHAWYGPVQPQSPASRPVMDRWSLVSPKSDWTIRNRTCWGRQNHANVTRAVFPGRPLPHPAGPGRFVIFLTFYLTFHCYIVSYEFILNGRFRL